MQLASRFASHSPTLRSDYPLSDDQIRRVAPSILADAPHESCSERYAYIPHRRCLLASRAEAPGGVFCYNMTSDDARLVPKSAFSCRRSHIKNT